MAGSDGPQKEHKDVCNKPFRVWMLFCAIIWLITGIVANAILESPLIFISLTPVAISTIIALYCLTTPKKHDDTPDKRSSCLGRKKKGNRFKRVLITFDGILTFMFLGVLIPQWIIINGRSWAGGESLKAYVTATQVVMMVLHFLCWFRAMGIDVTAGMISSVRGSCCIPHRGNHCPNCGRGDDGNNDDDAASRRLPRYRIHRNIRSGYAVLVQDDTTDGERTPTGRYRDDDDIPIFTPSASGGTLPPPSHAQPPPPAQSDDPSKMGQHIIRTPSTSNSSEWSRPSRPLSPSTIVSRDEYLPPYRAPNGQDYGA